MYITHITIFDIEILMWLILLKLTHCVTLTQKPLQLPYLFVMRVTWIDGQNDVTARSVKMFGKRLKFCQILKQSS